jgi:long-chain acyl-CoA synthetase
MWVGPIVTPGKESIITALPLYHIFSFTVNLLYFYSIGSNNILVTNPRDLKSFVNTLKKNKFTIITGVNTLFNLLLTSSSFKKINFSALKFTVGGGMSVLSSTAKKWKKITGVDITQGYGLTETAPIVSVNIISEPFNGTIGPPMPSTDISIRDEKNNELSINQEGELCVKGPQVMSEYWNNPEETKNSFTDDGFFKTGDIAIINENGSLKIVDRKKDMIISSGFNVYPNEIEDYVAQHPDVRECGVIGVNDSNRGESIRLFIVKEKKNLREIEVIDFCKKGLAIYKIPRKVIFIDEIPKNNVGKILRRKLREI